MAPVAVREAITNAVAHSDHSQSGAPIRVSIFDDRLEVENPGLLPFGLTVDDGTIRQLAASGRLSLKVTSSPRTLAILESWFSVGFPRPFSIPVSPRKVTPASSGK